MNEQPTRQTNEFVWVNELAFDTCWRFLEAEPMGRVAFDRGGRPMILPVNHVVHGHTIVFRTEPGSPLGELVARQPVAFEADAIAPDRRTGWSILISGEIERLDDDDKRRVRPSKPQPWAPGDRDVWLRIVPTTVTGRAICRRHRQLDGAARPSLSPD